MSAHAIARGARPHPPERRARVDLVSAAAARTCGGMQTTAQTTREATLQTTRQTTRQGGAEQISIGLREDRSEVHPIADRAPRTTLGWVDRSRCPTCDGERLADVWRGTLGEPATRWWLAHHRYATDPVAELGADAEIRLVRCLACTMLFHARVLDEAGMARLYSYWIDAQQIDGFERRHTGADAPGARFASGRRLLQHLLRLAAITGRAGTLRMLELGCGDGRLVQLAQLLGLEAWGVDPSATRCERARIRGLRVARTLEDAMWEGARDLDAVVAIEVLEHLVDPAAAVGALARALRPGGALLVEVPDAAGIAGPPRTFDEFRIVHPLEHVNAFTGRTLERLCAGAGLVPVRAPAAHVTSRLREVLRGELGRWAPRTTSRYFVRAEAGKAA